MSYAICNVVVGYSLNGFENELLDYFNECDLDPEVIGFENFYSGSGNTPYYCGVKIYEFTEADDLIRISEFIPKLLPNEKQVAQAIEKLEIARAKIAALLDGEVPASWPKDELPDDKEDLITYRTGEERERILSSLPNKVDTYLIWSTS